MFLWDVNKSVAYNDFSRKDRFRVEVNVFREEMFITKKKFVNLVELILLTLVSLILFALYVPNFGKFIKFLGQKTEKHENYNYPYLITNVCCVLKLCSTVFYFIQGVYNWQYPLSSSYSKHHLVSFSHFLACLLSHLSGYLFTFLLIFIA